MFIQTTTTTMPQVHVPMIGRRRFDESSYSSYLQPYLSQMEFHDMIHALNEKAQVGRPLSFVGGGLIALGVILFIVMFVSVAGSGAAAGSIVGFMVPVFLCFLAGGISLAVANRQYINALYDTVASFNNQYNSRNVRFMLRTILVKSDHHHHHRDAHGHHHHHHHRNVRRVPVGLDIELGPTTTQTVPPVVTSNYSPYPNNTTPSPYVPNAAPSYTSYNPQNPVMYSNAQPMPAPYNPAYAAPTNTYNQV